MKRLVVGAHYGLRDWLAQRITAVIMTLYTLIMAGVWTSVCVMFPALDAKAAGYKVYAVMDA